jgi:hypothetical protein
VKENVRNTRSRVLGKEEGNMAADFVFVLGKKEKRWEKEIDRRLLDGE